MLLVETFNVPGAREFMRTWCKDKGYKFESRISREPAWDFNTNNPKPEMIAWYIMGAEERDVDFTDEVWLYSVWGMIY